MSEPFQEVNNWAAVLGRWDLASDRRIYTAPDEESRRWAHGICVSNIRFSEGEARTKIRFRTAAPEGRLLFGYRSLTDPYVTIGLGGHDRAYTLYHYEPGSGSRSAAFAGSRENLVHDHPYEVSVRVQGQRVRLEVDGVQVLEHVLEAPLPQGQFGLFAWGTDSVEFTETAVRQKAGTLFVVMQFSDPYNDVYNDVITQVAKEFKLLAYHAGEVFGHGVILEDIVNGIIEAKIVVAEITPPNQNVFYELGYAHALRKPTILLADRSKQLPFDIRGYRCLFYDNTIGGRRNVEDGLRKHIAAILGE